MPLAVLARSDEPEKLLAEVAECVMHIAPEQGRSELVGCTALLAGLRFEHDLIYHLLSEEIMEESVIYQDILRKGEIKGEIKGERKTVLRILRHRFGPIAPEIEAQIRSLNQDSLDELTIAQIDFQQLSDLENWLASRAVQM
jgi:predicted transposase YdaD